jgi:hypothetical protein
MSSSSSAQPHHQACQNCGTPLTGPYCSKCGQHDVDYNQSFTHLSHDLLENLFHFEGKIFVSVAWLLARPGKLTNEFNAGRRQSQLHPLRFYIFVSVLFFLGVTLLNQGHLFQYDARAADAEFQRGVQVALKNGRQPGVPLTPAQKQELAQRLKQEEKNGYSGPAVIEAVDQAEAAAEKSPGAAPDATKGPTTKLRIDRSTEMGRRIADKISSGEFTLSGFMTELEHRAPTLLFLGVPVFALLLKLLYFRSKRPYIEHLIFSLHLHTWVFLAWMVSNGWLRLAGFGPAWGTRLLDYAVLLWMVWYFVSAFRVVYHQSWIKSFVKAAVASFVYLFALGLIFVAFAAGTFFWLAAE